MHQWSSTMVFIAENTEIVTEYRADSQLIFTVALLFAAFIAVALWMKYNKAKHYEASDADIKTAWAEHMGDVAHELGKPEDKFRSFLEKAKLTRTSYLKWKEDCKHGGG